LNGSGQLGDGTTTNRSAPTLISSLSAVTKIGVGFDHGLAVDSAGVVYSWGANGNGQLGDGTQIGRTLPVAISGAGYAWRVATPNFSVASGTYNTDRTVALTSDTVGATIYYTRNGAEPAETDLSVASGGTVMVTESQTLKAKAFVTAIPPSATATAVYTMQVATPTFSPAGGTYTSPRTVSISTATPGSTLYYTTDGTVPTVSSPVYTAPFTVLTTTTVKAIGMKANWSNSSVQTVTYTMNFGTLAAPTISPASGSYVGDLLVTLSSAQSGAVIRYTTNGSTPTASSTAYVDPIVVSATSTVKAKAFHPDYTTSAEASATYTMTASTPVLSVASGSYAAGTVVTISSPDSSATIRITTSGLDPTASDPTVASGTAILIGAFTLKAKAFKSGAQDSGVASATYTLTSSYGIGAVAAGASHTLVATPDGVVYAWGANSNGQLGDGTTTSPRTTPTLIQGLTGIIQLAAGSSHSVALRADGTVWSFGYNGSGQLGDGTNNQKTSPARITTLNGVVAIAAGDSHSLALTSDGRVWTWGANGSGQLGQGSTTQILVPTMISGLTGVIAIAAGSSHTLAVKGDGTVWAFGANGSGQLGDGTTNQHRSPVQMTGVSTGSAVSGGSSHSLIRLTDGTVLAAGSNNGGQLGDGTTTPRWTPVAVANLTNVSLIEAAGSQSYAVLTDGTLWAWGANGNGQLGDGTTNSHSWAQLVAGPVGVTQVASGSTHAVAVTSDGVVWTWGGNGSGQLGDGSTMQRLTPDTISASNYQWRVAVPVFSPSGGAFTANQNVAVTSATTGAEIHYTLNGTEPTQSDPTVASGGTVLIDQSRTLKARAWKAGVPTSATTTGVFTLAVASISMSPTGGTFTSPTTVTLSTATSGATIRYTTDGTTPTESSTAYSAPLSVSTSTVIKAVGFKTNWSSSAVASSTYTMNFGTLSAPTISPGTGGYSGSVTVTLSSNQSGATVRYTTNGSTPTSSSTAYTTPLVIASSLTLKAKAFHPDYTTSAEASAGYTITLLAPTFSLASGTYAPGTAVTVTSPDPTATIRITLNGSDPTSTDPIASGSSVILGSFTLKARAFKSGVQDSPVTSATYVIDGQLSIGSLAAGARTPCSRRRADSSTCGA
jgi:alpha-tubulin suppressor-like RCC1 family protein